MTRIARLSGGIFDPLSSHGGPIARERSIVQFGSPCGIPTGVPPEASLTSRRSAMTLRGTALIESILLSDIIAAQAAEPATVRGRLNVLPDGASDDLAGKRTRQHSSSSWARRSATKAA